MKEWKCFRRTCLGIQKSTSSSSPELLDVVWQVQLILPSQALLRCVLLECCRLSWFLEDQLAIFKSMRLSEETHPPREGFVQVWDWFCWFYFYSWFAECTQVCQYLFKQNNLSLWTLRLTKLSYQFAVLLLKSSGWSSVRANRKLCKWLLQKKRQ